MGFGIVKHSIDSLCLSRDHASEIFISLKLPRSIYNEILDWREFSLGKYHLVILPNSAFGGLLSLPYFTFIIL